MASLTSFKIFCNFKVIFEAVVRLRDDTPATTINLQAIATPTAGGVEDPAKAGTLNIGPLTVCVGYWRWKAREIYKFSFQVESPTVGDIPTDTVKADEVSVRLHDNHLWGANFSTGEKMWIPFYISFPPEKTLKMEVRTQRTKRHPALSSSFSKKLFFLLRPRCCCLRRTAPLECTRGTWSSRRRTPKIQTSFVLPRPPIWGGPTPPFLSRREILQLLCRQVFFLVFLSNRNRN